MFVKLGNSYISDNTLVRPVRIIKKGEEKFVVFAHLRPPGGWMEMTLAEFETKFTEHEEASGGIRCPTCNHSLAECGCGSVDTN